MPVMAVPLVAVTGVVLASRAGRPSLPIPMA